MEGDRETVDTGFESDQKIRRNVWNILQILQHQHNTGYLLLEGAGKAEVADEESDEE